MSDVYFVSRRPKLVKQTCVKGVISQGFGVVNKDTVVFPEEFDPIACVETEVCVRYLQQKNDIKVLQLQSQTDSLRQFMTNASLKYGKALACAVGGNRLGRH